MYTWGYGGFSVLARDNRESLLGVPIMIETDLNINQFEKKLFEVDLTYININFRKKENLIDFEVVDTGFKISTKVVKVQCVSMGTMILTDQGEIYYSGDKRYGQLPMADEEKKKDGVKLESEETQLFKQIHLAKPVKDIACGGDHVLALTTHDRVYAWGRNDSS